MSQDPIQTSRGSEAKPGVFPTPVLHPASFRDPESRVLVFGGRVYRAFLGSGAPSFLALRTSGLLDRLISAGLVFPYSPLDLSQCPELAAVLPSGSVAIEHPPLNFVSYAYEWSFEMLRAAAMLHLELLATAIESGFVLKDASSYNVQFIGPRPVFIDLGSFSPYEDGKPWLAYSQFCRMFLNPLILSSAMGIGFHPWLRSSLEGIGPEDLSRLLGIRHKLRPSILLNVVLHSILRGRMDVDRATLEQPELQVSKRATLKLIQGLRDIIARLTEPRSQSAWATYEESNSYSSADRVQKDRFVDDVLARSKPRIIWDLGCNRGEHTLTAARHGVLVVAMDNDAQIIDTLYGRVKSTHANILPLVIDVLNPSPDQGWSQRERLGLSERGKADFLLCLALVHHLRFTGNVPLKLIIDWLADVARQGILEFVPRADPMVRRLLRWRPDIYVDYDQSTVEALLSARFRITEVCRLPESGRTLYRFCERPLG